ncbi:hypothetical protein D3C87_1519900 [compost metagenome]
MGEHHRPRRIVDSLANDQLAIGADLQPLVQRFGLDRQHGLDGGALRLWNSCQQLGLALGEQRLEVQRLDDVGRGDLG